MNKSLQAPLISAAQIADFKSRAMADAKEIMVDLKSKSGGALFAVAHSKMVLRLLKEGSAWRTEAFKQIEERLASLEAEITQLREERATMSLADAHRGTFQRGCKYRRGELVTCAGGIWLALDESTTAQPGNGDQWRLVVKAAR